MYVGVVILLSDIGLNEYALIPDFFKETTVGMGYGEKVRN